MCASVERLRASGYITRNPDHPHILVYVPDPGEEEPSVEHGYTNSSVVEVSEYIIGASKTYGSLCECVRAWILEVTMQDLALK